MCFMTNAIQRRREEYGKYSGSTAYYFDHLHVGNGVNRIFREQAEDQDKYGLYVGGQEYGGPYDRVLIVCQQCRRRKYNRCGGKGL